MAGGSKMMPGPGGMSPHPGYPGQSNIYVLLMLKHTVVNIEFASLTHLSRLVIRKNV